MRASYDTDMAAHGGMAIVQTTMLKGSMNYIGLAKTSLQKSKIPSKNSYSCKKGRVQVKQIELYICDKK